MRASAGSASTQARSSASSRARWRAIIARSAASRRRAKASAPAASWLASATLRATRLRLSAANSLRRQPLGRRRRGGGDVQPLGGERQQAGVDRVGLGQPPERVGELAGPVGVEHHHRDPGLGQRREDREVHAPGRLQRDAADLEAAEPAEQLAHAGAGVGDAPGRAPTSACDANVEPGFTHVDPDVSCDPVGAVLALHSGLAPFHLFRTQTDGGRTRLLYGAFRPGRHGPDRRAGEAATSPAHLIRNCRSGQIQYARPTLGHLAVGSKQANGYRGAN